MSYWQRVLLGLDQFGNTIIGGYPDETISARAGRYRTKSGFWAKVWWHPLADALDKIQPNHVELAEQHETDGSQQDPAYRDHYKK